MNIPQTKDKYMFMLDKCDECMIAYPQTFFIQSSMRSNIERKEKMSGYAVMFMGTISNLHEYKTVEWDNTHIKALK